MSEEIKEILEKLSNRKQETLLQGLRECQLKNIEHVFITREEYIDKILNYINELQQENQNLKGTIETYDILLKSNFKAAKVIEELEKWLREQHEKVWDKVAEEMLIDTLFKLKQLQEESK